MALTNATGLWDGAALNSTPNFNAGVREKVHISSEDKSVLRLLASQVAEYASRPIEREKRELWRKHNDLEPTRPVVFCDPENGWNEIITDDRLQCDGWLAKRWEIVLRKELFWAEQMKDDKVIEPFFDIGYTHSDDDWGIHAEQIGGTDGGAYVWKAGLKDEQDVEKLHLPVCDIDYDTTQATLELAKDTFEGILTVRRIGSWWWSLGLTVELAQFLGLEQIMLDMVDRPELIHRVMGILRDGMLQKLDFLEKNHLLSLNTDQYVGSGGFGYTRVFPNGDHNEVVKTKDMWGFCESQETVGISPKMFARFVFPYQLPLLEKFGLNCYGCCEPLDLRWHIIKQIPNLRRISVSPWADLQKMAELLEDNYVFSMKPSPADLATPTIDEETIRKRLKNSLEITRGCRVEIIMKDNHTIGNNPQNVIRWVQIAREEAEQLGV
jgi:hypothetical protein